MPRPLITRGTKALYETSYRKSIDFNIAVQNTIEVLNFQLFQFIEVIKELYSGHFSR